MVYKPANITTKPHPAIAGWFIMENPICKWMIFLGIPILGKLRWVSIKYDNVGKTMS